MKKNVLTRMMGLAMAGVLMASAAGCSNKPVGGGNAPAATT